MTSAGPDSELAVPSLHGAGDNHCASMPTLSSTENPLPGAEMLPQSGMGRCFFLSHLCGVNGPIPFSVLQNINTTPGKSSPPLGGVPGTAGNCCHLQRFPNPHQHCFATQEEDLCLSALSPPLLTPQHQGSAQSTSAARVSSSLPQGQTPGPHSIAAQQIAHRSSPATEAIAVQQDLGVTIAKAFQKTREHRLSFKLESAEQTGFLPPPSLQQFP